MTLVRSQMWLLEIERFSLKQKSIKRLHVTLATANKRWNQHRQVYTCPDITSLQYYSTVTDSARKLLLTAKVII